MRRARRATSSGAPAADGGGDRRARGRVRRRSCRPVPLRMHATTPDGELLLMPAAGPQGVGVKLSSLTPANPERGLPVRRRARTSCSTPARRSRSPSIDGAALTALRTGAVCGLATRWLARRGRAAAGGVRRRRAGAVAPRGDAGGARPRGRGRDRRPDPREARPRPWRRSSARDVGDARGRRARPTSCARARRARPRSSTAAGAPAGAHVNAVGAYTPGHARGGHRHRRSRAGGRRDARGGARRGRRPADPDRGGRRRRRPRGGRPRARW